MRGQQQQLAGLLLLLCLAVVGQAQVLPPCEHALPPGDGFGGSVTITADCLWRPQLHFISAISGEQQPPNYAGARGVPTIYFEPASLNVQSGPSKLSLDSVILANFTLNSPRQRQVLWPKGLLPASQQPGDSTPRRLLLTDVRILVSAQSLREYVSFFRNSSQHFYTDNSTFVHVPYWSDDATTAVNVGLLLAVDGQSPSALAGKQPLPGRNFVLAADSSTLLAVMQSGAAVRTSVPFLMYLSSNVSFSSALLKVRALPVNRPLLVVGLSMDNTSVDFGMEVNTLQLGPQGSVTFNRVILENLAPGDARSAALAGPYEAAMAYYMWAVAFDRGAATTPRLVADNCTLVVSTAAAEQFLLKATLFRVRPAGFGQQLQRMAGHISRWDVGWVEEPGEGDNIYVDAFYATAVSFSQVTITPQPMVAAALPLPIRSGATAAAPQTQAMVSDFQLTHVGVDGLQTTSLAAAGAGARATADAPDVVMLTTNVTLRPDGAAAPAASDSAVQLRRFLASSVEHAARSQQHVLVGIVTPPVTLDVAYSTVVRLPPAMPAGHFGIVNVVMLHLPQGPKATSQDANVLLPDVWTHLLWSIPRSISSVVYLSNVTLWVPAAEFSFIRSHTAEQPTSFTINLQGDANMRFYNVWDLRAAGVFIQSYKGPGLEAESLTLRVEPGWAMNGQPPRGFWGTSGQLAPGQLPGSEVQESGKPKMSEAMVVVLAACLVTAVVASVLACLAFVFYRKRAAEHRLQLQRQAELESGKAGSQAGGGGPGSPDSTGGSTGGSGHGGGSGPSALAGGPGAARLKGILPGLLRDSMPVHDSSDSYNLPEAVDRAALTAELARSKFGPRNLAVRDGDRSDSSRSSDRSDVGQRRGGRGYGAPPAAALGGASVTSMASDACLARLQSAISVMSQDVLSRRLQYATGADGSPVVLGVAGAGAAAGAAAAGALARPSLLGLGQGQQQQQQWLTPPPEAAGEEHLLRQASGSLAARSISSSLGRDSGHGGSPRDAAAAELLQQQQQDRLGRQLEAAGDPVGQQQRLTGGAGLAGGAAAAAAGAGLAKSSVGSSQASRMGSSSGGIDQLKLLQLVGQGTFGQVYKALWRRRCVAVKVLQLPATAGSSDVPWRGMGRTTSHREKMAVMETVVSTTMSHPNIVQVYTYVLQPLLQDAMSHTSKQQQRHLRQQQEQEQEEAQQQQPGQQGVAEQQQLEQQQIELQPQPKQQGAAAQLLARLRNTQQPQQQAPPQQPQQPGGKLLPDLPEIAAATGSSGSRQQQELGAQRSGSSQHSSRGGGVVRDDSSQSLHSPGLARPSKDLSRLTPEMAKAAAAALPAAAAAAAAASGEEGEGFRPRQQQQRRLSSGSSHGGPGAEAAAGSEDEDASDNHLGPVVVGYQLRLVMEFCDAGSLRTALDHKLLIDRTTGLPALECVLFLAHDVACAMIHLHSEHLLHGDLKASNVLLKRTAPRLPLQQDQPAQGAAAADATGTGLGRRHQGHTAGSLCGQGLGLMAKVADFGLSLSVLLLHGRASKASDVYAFGILLWELATGRRPYSGTPVGMLAHKVVQQGWRPAWPGGCSLPVKLLVESCWTQDAADRPTFEQVVQQLEEMAGHLDELKQQQAHAMAVAAAPLFNPAQGGHGDSDAGHELTPSMMDEFMPSGFGPAGPGPADIEEEGECSGVLYEMSQISGGSQERGPLALTDLGGSDDDADAAVLEGGRLEPPPCSPGQGGVASAAAAGAPVPCGGAGGSCSHINSHSSGSKRAGCSMAAAS